MLEKELDDDIVRYRQQALAVSTKKSYTSQLKSYLLFCQLFNYCPVPVTQSALLRYTAYLAKRLSPQSLPAYLNIVRLLHLEGSLCNPLVNNFELDTLLKGIKREKGVTVSQALPITPQILLKLRCLLDLSAPYWANFWAACLIGFFAFLRKSNLFKNSDNDHYIRREGVLVDSSGQVFLVLNSTKTIQYKERQLILPLPCIPDHPLCPVNAIKHLFALCPTHLGTDPLFQISGSVGGSRPLNYQQFLKDLKRLLCSLGLGKGFSGHSFRRGGASFMLQSGIPGELIKVMGDWRSDAYQRYLDVSVSTRSVLVARVAECVRKNC